MFSFLASRWRCYVTVSMNMYRHNDKKVILYQLTVTVIAPGCQVKCRAAVSLFLKGFDDCNKDIPEATDEEEFVFVPSGQN